MGVRGLVRPVEGEFPPRFAGYIGLVPEGDVVAFLEEQLEDFLKVLEGVTEEVGMRVEPPYGWSVKQVVGHVTDAERIFAYRLLRIGRGDATALASFDENAFVAGADFNQCPLADLVREFEWARRSHVLLLKHMQEEAWDREGMVCEHRTVARTLPFVMAGHVKHHLAIVRRRLGR